MFYPAGGDPTTLDVLAGITTGDYDCLTDKGPLINLYFEEHEVKKQYLCVIVLQDHLSAQYLSSQKEMLNDNDIGFYRFKENSFIRVMSKEPIDGDLPFMEFGSSHSTYNVYQADQAISVELDAIAMTNYLFALQDGVYRDAIDIVQSMVIQSEDRDPQEIVNYASILSLPDVYQNRMNDNLLLQKSCEKGSKFRAVISVNGQPCDSVDGGHVNAGVGASYTSHNDASNKVGNFSNVNQYSHQDFMRIHTMGIQGSTDVTSKAILPKKNLSLRHGYANNDWFNLKGHFYNEGNTQAFTTPKVGSKIEFGGECHSHIQPPGSQVNGLEHLVERSSNSSGIHRVFISLRSFLPFRNKLKLRMEELPDSKVHKNEEQIYSNIIDHVSGKVHVQGQGHRVRNHSKSLMSKPTLSRGKTKEARKKKKKKPVGKKLQSALFKNGSCTECCLPHRDRVISMPNPSKHINEIAQHIAVAKCAYDNDSTLGVTCVENVKGRKVEIVTLNGPRVKTTPNSGKFTLCQPWIHQEPDLYHNTGVTANKHHKDIINPDNPQTLILYSPSKNHSSLLKNINILMNEKNESLQNMMVRGTGGALNFAGALPRSIAQETKSDATCELSTHANINCRQCKALQENCIRRRCMDVFYEKRYLGVFFIRKQWLGSMDSFEEAKEELEKFSQLLTMLNKMDPVTFPSRDVNRDMRNELNAMLAVSFWYELEPVFPDHHKKWTSEEDIPWNYITMNANRDFQVPHYECNRKVLGDIVGIGATSPLFADINTLLDYSRCMRDHNFFTKAARARLNWESERKEKMPAGVLILEPSVKQKITKDAVFGAMLHVAAATLIKATTPSLVKFTNDEATLSTCTLVLSKEVNITPEDLTGKHNLKNTIAKPVHPDNLMREVVAYICQVATKSFEDDLDELNDENEFINRNGGLYFCSNEGLVKAFQCIHITVTNTCHWVNLATDDSGSISGVTPDSVESFLDKVDSLQWQATFVHKLFRSCIKTKAEYTTFFKELASNIDVLKVVVMLSNNNYDKDRRKCSRRLIRVFFRLGLNIDEFQAHVIMRSIEMCMHEPFGEVNHIEGGSGSKDAAKLLGKDWDTSTNVSDIAKGLLEYLNKRVWNNDELVVLGLKWNESLNCLQHRSGIGKKLDISDLEHTLCCIFKLYKNTGASRNQSETIQFGDERFFPIKLPKLNAAEQTFMNHLTQDRRNVILSYLALLKNEQYMHSCLDEIFRIDLKQKSSPRKTHKQPRTLLEDEDEPQQVVKRARKGGDSRASAASTQEEGVANAVYEVLPLCTPIIKVFYIVEEGNNVPCNGTVNKWNPTSRLYNVKFDDGDEVEIPYEEMHTSNDITIGS